MEPAAEVTAAPDAAEAGADGEIAVFDIPAAAVAAEAVAPETVAPETVAIEAVGAATESEPAATAGGDDVEHPVTTMADTAVNTVAKRVARSIFVVGRDRRTVTDGAPRASCPQNSWCGCVPAQRVGAASGRWMAGNLAPIALPAAAGKSRGRQNNSGEVAHACI